MQNLFSSSLISKNIKIKIYRIITLPLVWYGCPIWLLTLREEVFVNRVLKSIFGSERYEVARIGEEYILWSLMLVGLLLTKYYSNDEIEKNEIDGACNTYGRE
jgi:hypothetical protein